MHSRLACTIQESLYSHVPLLLAALKRLCAIRQPTAKTSSNFQGVISVVSRGIGGKGGDGE